MMRRTFVVGLALLVGATGQNTCKDSNDVLLQPGQKAFVKANCKCGSDKKDAVAAASGAGADLLGWCEIGVDGKGTVKAVKDAGACKDLEDAAIADDATLVVKADCACGKTTKVAALKGQTRKEATTGVAAANPHNCKNQADVLVAAGGANFVKANCKCGSEGKDAVLVKADGSTAKDVLGHCAISAKGVGTVIKIESVAACAKDIGGTNLVDGTASPVDKDCYCKDKGVMKGNTCKLQDGTVAAVAKTATVCLDMNGAEIGVGKEAYVKADCTCGWKTFTDAVAATMGAAADVKAYCKINAAGEGTATVRPRGWRGNTLLLRS